MRRYSVHLPPHGTASERLEAMRLVPMGVSWLGLLVAPVFLLVNRLWVPFLAWVALTLALSLAAGWLPAWAGFVLSLLPSLWLFLEGHAMRRERWEAMGWREAGLSAGAGRAEAELRWLEAHSPMPERPRSEPRLPMRQPLRPSAPLGLFPE